MNHLERDGDVIHPRTEASAEVTLEELGDAVAAAASRIQAELGAYDTPLGAFGVDELELVLPLDARIDDLGQAQVAVRGAGNPAGGGQIRLRIRPTGGAPKEYPATARSPLAVLGTLSPEAIRGLAARRVFSVDDLLRVARSAAGRTALGRLFPLEKIELALRRAEFLASPLLPFAVAQAILAVDPAIDGPRAFSRINAAALAAKLSERLGQAITVETIQGWQQNALSVDQAQVLAVPAAHAAASGGISVAISAGNVTGIVGPIAPPPPNAPGSGITAGTIGPLGQPRNDARRKRN